MNIVFQRTGQRRYAVFAQRAPLPDLEMNPAPGYDPLMPHDLVHLVVEAKLGLKRGIFGQLAAGGDAGTFHPIFHSGQNARAAARLRHRVRAKGKSLLREGKNEAAQSERATYICWQFWRTRSALREERSAAKAMTSQANHLRTLGREEESHQLDSRKLSEICNHLDELSSHWSKLNIGESMSIHWPDLTIC
jgi:hypothetical protein